MPEKLTTQEKYEIINNIKAAGDEDDVDYAEVILAIQEMNLPTTKDVVNVTPMVNIPREHFESFLGKGIDETTRIFNDPAYYEEIRNKFGIDKISGMDEYIRQFNESGVMPYQLRYVDKSENMNNIAFYKDVESYGLYDDANRRPVYIKKYKDGTEDVITKEQFMREKNYKYLPESKKKEFSVPVTEYDKNVEKTRNYVNTYQTNYRMKKTKN